MIYHIPPLPDPDDLPPAPSAPLALAPCEACGDEPSDDCRTCYGSGDYEVCSACGERPWITAGVEACSCTFGPADEPEVTAYRVCETCDRNVLETELDNANVCRTCRSEMEEIIRNETEEPAYDLHPEVRWAIDAGMVRPEQVGL